MCWAIPRQRCVQLARLSTSVYECSSISSPSRQVCFTTSSHLSDLLSSAGNLPHLKTIVLLDTQGPSLLRPGEVATNQLARQWAAQNGIALVTWNELVEIGRKNIVAHNPPTDNSTLAGYCYTSGTTGNPKAAKIAHRQIAIAAGCIGLQNPEEEGTIMISYLPLAHIYGRILEAYILRAGAAIGYFSGDVTRIIEDAQILQPTVFPGVPRIFNRIASLLKASIDGPGLKGKLLRTAVAAKIANHDATGSITHAFYDRVVFRKVRAVLGGKVKFMASGSAPIRPDVLKLLRVCFSADIREGYGQTENSGLCLMMSADDKHLGSCGPPVYGIELRLKDCPELGYTSKDTPMPRGELLSRGQSVFDGYYKDEAKTKETFEDGWLLSGDVAAVDAAGRFYIIDRVKNLIKLSQGEYVAIENVEGKLSSVKQLAQLWLYGDSKEDHLVAVGVPEPDVFAPFASTILGETISASDPASLERACNDPKVTDAVLREMTNLGRRENLKGYEIPRALKLRAEPFSAENGLLTPTFKMKRPEAAKIMAKDLERLYAHAAGDGAAKL
jgi:long-chain acyl-CoA synthetase